MAADKNLIVRLQMAKRKAELEGVTPPQIKYQLVSTTGTWLVSTSPEGPKLEVFFELPRPRRSAAEAAACSRSPC